MNMVNNMKEIKKEEQQQPHFAVLASPILSTAPTGSNKNNNDIDNALESPSPTLSKEYFIK